MLDAKLVKTLPQLPSPVLTVYLDTKPVEPRNHRRPSGTRLLVEVSCEGDRLLSPCTRLPSRRSRRSRPG